MILIAVSAGAYRRTWSVIRAGVRPRRSATIGTELASQQARCPRGPSCTRALAGTCWSSTSICTPQITARTSRIGPPLGLIRRGACDGGSASHPPPVLQGSSAFQRFLHGPSSCQPRNVGRRQIGKGSGRIGNGPYVEHGGCRTVAGPNRAGTERRLQSIDHRVRKQEAEVAVRVPLGNRTADIWWELIGLRHHVHRSGQEWTARSVRVHQGLRVSWIHHTATGVLRIHKVHGWRQPWESLGHNRH